MLWRFLGFYRSAEVQPDVGTNRDRILISLKKLLKRKEDSRLAVETWLQNSWWKSRWKLKLPPERKVFRQFPQRFRVLNWMQWKLEKKVLKLCWQTKSWKFNSSSTMESKLPTLWNLCVCLQFERLWILKYPLLDILLLVPISLLKLSNILEYLSANHIFEIFAVCVTLCGYCDIYP